MSVLTPVGVIAAAPSSAADILDVHASVSVSGAPEARPQAFAPGIVVPQMTMVAAGASRGAPPSVATTTGYPNAVLCERAAVDDQLRALISDQDRAVTYLSTTPAVAVPTPPSAA
ncbi:MAG: hypothetical protein ACLPVY_21190 [Acidimicrobiia bacterium]